MDMINHEMETLMQKGGRIVLKYHNDMNVFSFGGFNQRELNLFFLICGLMREQEETLILPFAEIKKIIGKTAFKNNKDLVNCVVETNKKFLKLNGEFKKGSTLVQFVLFPTFKTDSQREVLKVSVNPEFSYILNELTKNFTLFELQEFYSLNSTYSKNLFRLLKQYKSTGVYYVTLEEFRRLLDVPEAYEMRKITDKILNPALKELANHFDNLRIEKIRSNRRITALRFTFEPQLSKHITRDNDASKSIDMCETEEDSFRELPCPYCGKCLEKIKTATGSFFGHKNFTTGGCRKTFSSLEEVEKAQQAVEREKAETEKRLKAEAEAKAKEQAAIAHRKKIKDISDQIYQVVSEYPAAFYVQSIDLEKEKLLLFNKLKMVMVEYPINEDTLNTLRTVVNNLKSLE
ncbi:MAG: replication initiation protein [Negativicoccus succinicivorans]|nr:replication initiation protein [Negativicoccus succinicivorans]